MDNACVWVNDSCVLPPNRWCEAWGDESTCKDRRECDWVNGSCVARYPSASPVAGPPSPTKAPMAKQADPTASPTTEQPPVVPSLRYWCAARKDESTCMDKRQCDWVDGSCVPKYQSASPVAGPPAPSASPSSAVLCATGDGCRGCVEKGCGVVGGECLLDSRKCSSAAEATCDTYPCVEGKVRVSTPCGTKCSEVVCCMPEEGEEASLPWWVIIVLVALPLAGCALAFHFWLKGKARESDVEEKQDVAELTDYAIIS